MLVDILGQMALVTFVMSGLLTLTRQEMADLEKYYSTAYQNQGKAEEESVNSDYVRIAEGAAAGVYVKEAIAYFVQTHGL